MNSSPTAAGLGLPAPKLWSRTVRESMGSESYKKMLMHNHNVKEPCFGVKIGDLVTLGRLGDPHVAL